MRRRRVLASLAAVVLAGCGKQRRQRHRLRVGLIPRFTLAPLYLADELGFFREAGLEVEFRQVQGTVQMLPPLVGGGLEVSFNMASAGLVNAVLKGARLRIVASREVAVPGCGTGGAIFAHRRAFPQGLRDLRQLKGKRVAIGEPAGLTAFFLDQILGSAGMSTHDVEVVAMRRQEAAAALIGGKLDAISAADFDKDLDLVSADVIRSVTLADVLPNCQYSFVLFGPALLDGDPEIGTRFLEAYLRGVREFRSGTTPRALESLALASHTSPAQARAACRDFVTADGRVDLSSIQRFVDWAAKRGFTPQAVDASQLIETRFIEAALHRLARRTGSQR